MIFSSVANFGNHPLDKQKPFDLIDLTWLLFSVSSLLLFTPQQLAKIWSVGDTLGVLEEESPCSELCSWDLSEIGDKTWNFEDDKIMFDLWVLSSNFGLLWKGMERLELLWHELMLLIPAPLSDELTKLATLPWNIEEICIRFNIAEEVHDCS
jgi:hypothetical protein